MLHHILHHLGGICIAYCSARGPASLIHDEENHFLWVFSKDFVLSIWYVLIWKSSSLRLKIYSIYQIIMSVKFYDSKLIPTFQAVTLNSLLTFKWSIINSEVFRFDHDYCNAGCIAFTLNYHICWYLVKKHYVIIEAFGWRNWLDTVMPVLKNEHDMLCQRFPNPPNWVYWFNLLEEGDICSNIGAMKALGQVQGGHRGSRFERK